MEHGSTAATTRKSEAPQAFPDIPDVQHPSDPEWDSVKNGNDGSSGVHRRSLSGSLFSRLSFLRMTQSTDENHGNGGHSRRSIEEDESSASTTRNAYNPGQPESPRSQKSGGSLASVLQQKKVRRRKGSLRKTALLGTGALRDRRGYKALESPVSRAIDRSDLVSPTSPEPPSSELTPRASYDRQGETMIVSSQWQSSDPYPVKLQRATSASNSTTTTTTASSIASPSLSATTDEDENLVFRRAPFAVIKKLASSSSESYFPVQSHAPPPVGTNMAHRRRLSTTPLEALAPIAAASGTELDEWDYSETEWWGWLILVTTWLVFVVGMGSCFGVWSWAWDVGETPYAPPELEDDPTLPIVGYYPALMVLTAVMAWVWVVVAWVGMKYFRHANISGDDF